MLIECCRLASVAAHLAELETRKAAAVAGEDYDSAKGMKAEIDSVRAAAGAPAAGHPDTSPWLRRCANTCFQPRPCP